MKVAVIGGTGRAGSRIVEELAEKSPDTIRSQINLLPGSHLTAADIEEIVEIIEAFGLSPVVLPDLSGSLDGHIPRLSLRRDVHGPQVGPWAGP